MSSYTAIIHKSFEAVKGKKSSHVLKVLILLFLLLSLSFGIRLLYVFTGSISFHYDMARDAFMIREIWSDYNPKVLGPPSSTEGLFHGVLYYYLLAPFYQMGGGDPRTAVSGLALINTLTVIPLFALALSLFKSRFWAFVSCLMFALSPLSVQFGTWLSNPSPVVFASALFFLGLYRWSKGEPSGFILAVFSAALAAQFQLFMLYLLFLLPVYYFFSESGKISLFSSRLVLFPGHPKISPHLIFMGLIVAVLVLGTYFISMVKFGTGEQFLTAFQDIFSFKRSISVYAYPFRIASLFSQMAFPSAIYVGAVLAVLSFFSAGMHRFVLFCLLSSFPLFILGGHNSGYVNVGLLIPAILALTMFLRLVSSVSRRTGMILIGLMIVLDIYFVLSGLPRAQSFLVIPEGMILSRQISLIDATYRMASGREFSINTLTLPLLTNTTWSYLYSWYGQSRYGYLPGFYGRDQTGVAGGNSLHGSSPLPLSFFIIDSPAGIRPGLISTFMNSENNYTRLIEEYNYGDLKLQLRQPL